MTSQQLPSMARSREEQLNTLSHALGLVLSMIGLILLISWRPEPLDWQRILVLSVFGGSLIALYLASTLYHAAKCAVRRRILKYCDHAAIFILIAATYTPFCLFGTGEHDGRWLVLAVWTFALVGVIAKFFFVGRFRFVSTAMYLLMGWIALFQIDLLAALPAGELRWIVGGGVSYSLGTVFYLWRSLPYSHAIWHLFVLGGSVCHYLGVLLYVA